MRTIPATQTLDDARLVELSRDGNREAFGRIVERYQSLVCALTYSASGSLQASEELAQVTFITAWCQLKSLREPGKLKSWLCRIARNVATDSFRRQQRTPTANAEELDANVSTDTTTPRDQVISKEEQAILWRVLEDLPTTYREPLILFYRQEQSVAEVAETLELSEDAVKQRLSRGREMLSERTAKFVETTLRSSGPGKAFTLGVLAVLPVLTTSAKAAAIGAAAAKGSATAKAAAASGFLSALSGPLLVIFGNYAAYRANLDEAQTEAEREHIKSFYRRLAACIVGFGLVLLPLVLWAAFAKKDHSILLGSLFVVYAASQVAAIVWFSIWSFRKRRKFLEDLAAKRIVLPPAKPTWEYRSRFTLFGLPLIHLRFGGGLPAQRTVVKAWIAAGDCAMGALFAFGGVAIAPFSIGGLAIGLLPFGGCALGVLALGGFAAGMWSYGGLAMGWQAFGGCALGWQTAYGGIAIAHDFAQGGFSLAAQAGNAMARQFIQSSWFYHFALVCARYSTLLNLLWVVPLLLWWRVGARARHMKQANSPS